MQEVQDGKQESDLATIRAWRETNTHAPVRRMLKDHLTTPQYGMWEDLHRRQRLAMRYRCIPSMKNDAKQAGLIRGLQRLTGLAEVRQRECWDKGLLHAAAVKAQKLEMMAQAQVTCGSCIVRVSQTHFTAAGSGAGDEKAEGSGSDREGSETGMDY